MIPGYKDFFSFWVQNNMTRIHAGIREMGGEGQYINNTLAALRYCFRLIKEEVKVVEFTEKVIRNIDVVLWFLYFFIMTSRHPIRLRVQEEDVEVFNKLFRLPDSEDTRQIKEVVSLLLYNNLILITSYPRPLTLAPRNKQKAGDAPNEKIPPI